MTHLAIARRLLSTYEIGDPAQFYLGSVAPDAYHWLRPKKRVEERALSHLSGKEGTRERIASRFRGPCDDFEIGYGLHLLVDLYWETAVLLPFLRSLPNCVYAHDMCVLDVYLYDREGAETAIFPHLAMAAARGFDDLISSEQAKLERDLTLTWYRSHRTFKDEPLQGAFPLGALVDAADAAECYAAREWAHLFVR